jgi:hypothetical protein
VPATERWRGASPALRTRAAAPRWLRRLPLRWRQPLATALCGWSCLRFAARFAPPRLRSATRSAPTSRDAQRPRRTAASVRAACWLRWRLSSRSVTKAQHQGEHQFLALSLTLSSQHAPPHCARHGARDVAKRPRCGAATHTRGVSCREDAACAAAALLAAAAEARPDPDLPAHELLPALLAATARFPRCAPLHRSALGALRPCHLLAHAVLTRSLIRSADRRACARGAAGPRRRRRGGRCAAASRRRKRSASLA